MPQFALDEASNVVAAVDCSERVATPEFECPRCYVPMTLAGGPHTQYVRHFRHTGESCYEYPDRRSQNEHHAVSTRDIAADLRAVGWAENVEEDCRHTRENPDVRFRCEGFEFVVEMQTRPIGADDVVERTHANTDEGFWTIWLFHDSVFDDAPLDETRPEFLTAQQGWFSMLTEDGSTDVWMPLYGPTQMQVGPLGSEWYLHLYSDMNAGSPERTVAFGKPKPFVGRGGEQLAASARTVRAFGDSVGPSEENEESSGGQRGLV